jgi:hypothetical protein
MLPSLSKDKAGRLACSDVGKQIMRFHTKSHLSQRYGMLPQRMTACNCNEQPSAEDRQQK